MLRHNYIENGDHRIRIDPQKTGKGFTMTWSNTGDTLDFPNRRKCLEWLLRSCPDANLYVSGGGISICAGTVRFLAERAGVRLRKREVSA